MAPAAFWHWRNLLPSCIFQISTLGDQMTALSRLTNCSLACNELSELPGGDLPRSLRSLQLYGNRLAAQLPALLTGCPPLESLGLGRTQLTAGQTHTAAHRRSD